MQALSWCTWAYVTYGAVLVRLSIATQGDPVLRHEAHAVDAEAALDRLLQVLDMRLAAQPWMLGSDYSLVDLIVAAVIGYSEHLGAPVTSHSHVQRWLKTVQARPAMQVDA
jgi:GST-like protein